MSPLSQYITAPDLSLEAAQTSASGASPIADRNLRDPPFDRARVFAGMYAFLLEPRM